MMKKSELANGGLLERTSGNSLSNLEESQIERFCQAWAEVGRAILVRRKAART